MDLDHLATSFQNQLNVRFGLTDPEALLIERLYMDSTYFTTLILHKNVNCLRIYGFSLRELPSSLRCLRTYHPLRFRSLHGLADASGFWQVGLTFYAALSL
jgi:hypothetical protein